MLTSSLPRLFSAVSLLCALASLTACGGNVDAALPATPALSAHTASTPVADCEPQACQGLRIIDSNAETFRADGARRDALAMAVAKLDSDAAPLQ